MVQVYPKRARIYPERLPFLKKGSLELQNVCFQTLCNFTLSMIICAFVFINVTYTKLYK